MCISLQFEVVQNDEVISSVVLDQDVIKVGKLTSSHLRLPADSDVSRVHAVIERGVDGSLTVIDLGSATGTFVDGVRVVRGVLPLGSDVRFGDVSVRVTEYVGSPTTQAPEPYTVQGHYDEVGNYHPGYFDEAGAYHDGYGYYDDEGDWCVVHGHYDPDGQWVDRDDSREVELLDRADAWILDVSDRDEMQRAFFADRGGDTLEVALLWRDHVLQQNTYARASVTIGAATANDFVVEDSAIPDDAFRVVSFEAGQYSVVFTSAMSGMICAGERTLSLGDAVESGLAHQIDASTFELPLSTLTSVRLDVGDCTLLVHFTDMPVVAGGRASGLDVAPVPYIAVSAAAHVALLLLAMMMPDTARSLDLDGYAADDRFVQLMVEPEQVEEEVPDYMQDKGGEEAAAKHKGEEGQAGKEDAAEVDRKMAIKGPDDNEDLELKKAQDKEIALTSGIASTLMVSSPWGATDTSIGSDAIHAIGALEADQFGEAKGFGGLGLRNAGRGGAGISEVGIGLANVGTRGRGGRGGRGGRYGVGAQDMGEHKTRVPTVFGGPVEVRGSLDREIIRRVVRQHRREVKYCYEQQLQKNRELAGRVVVRFTIAATGSVVASVVKESTIKNIAVENCIASKIRRWVFPEPNGGGIVIVNYPFNLSS